MICSDVPSFMLQLLPLCIVTKAVTSVRSNEVFPLYFIKTSKSWCSVCHTHLGPWPWGEQTHMEHLVITALQNHRITEYPALEGTHIRIIFADDTKLGEC